MACQSKEKLRYAVGIGHPFLKLIDSLLLKPYEHEPNYSVGLPHFTLFRTVTGWPGRTPNDVNGPKQTFAN